MIGVILGAGASYGSDTKCTPPLGSELYNSIKNANLGRRIHDGNEIQENVSLDNWVSFVSPKAKKLFDSGDFEGGMGCLDDAIKEKAKNSSVKLDVMSPTNEFGDISLQEKIMREVASYLSKFTPSDANLYFDLAKILPDKSHIFTLNYDYLYEAVCVSQKINLVENKLIQKQLLTHPVKTHYFHQLHGGISLHIFWPPRRFGIAGMQVNTDSIQRIAIRSFISNGLYFNLSPESYDENYKSNSVLAFYNKDKYVANAPKLLQDIQEEYVKSLSDNVKCLIVIGCRYLKHDNHIWEAVRNFRGPVFWCGSIDEIGGDILTLNHLGDHFSSSMNNIREVISNYS